MTDTMPERFALDASERANPLWRRLQAHFDDELQKRRVKNDGALDQFDTATLRGEIKLLRAIIDLGKDPPPIVRD